jgi:hypothetical protein
LRRGEGEERDLQKRKKEKISKNYLLVFTSKKGRGRNK